MLGIFARPGRLLRNVHVRGHDGQILVQLECDSSAAAFVNRAQEVCKVRARAQHVDQKQIGLFAQGNENLRFVPDLIFIMRIGRDGLRGSRAGKKKKSEDDKNNHSRWLARH